MKIGFSKEVKYSPEWRDNDTSSHPFTATMTVVSMETLITLMDTFKSAGIEPGDEVHEEDVDVDTLRKMLDTCGDLLPEHVKLSGLIGDGDIEITIQDVVEYGEFVGLAGELLGKLAEISSPNEDDAGN